MYINLFTLRNIAQKLDVSDAQNMKKKQLFLAILDKLDIKMNTPISLPPRKVEMINILTAKVLNFNSTYEAGKYFNKSNSSFCKKMNKGGGVIGGYHLLSDRVDEKESDSNDENPGLLGDETDNVFDSVENP